MKDALTTLLGKKLPAPVEGALEKLLLLDRFQDVYQHVLRTSAGRPFLESFLDTLRVRPRVSPEDLALVPKSGPVVAVANHPFGLIEGAILAAQLGTVRPDVKVLANGLLASIPEAQPYCIFVDPFGGEQAARANLRGLKESLAWLEQNGLLAVFPSGEVAHLNLKERAVVDPAWNSNVARIIRKSGATVLPIYFAGSNGAAFQLLGFLHPRVRTALLAHEFLNKSNRTIEVRIGNPISPAKLRTYQDNIALTRYLRHRTYLLGSRAQSPTKAFFAPKQLAVSSEADRIRREVAALDPSRTLTETEEFSVFCAGATEIPNALREIGRLREIAFREAGEGTGKSIDLDSFDEHYLHLWLWDRKEGEIAGAYRLGPSDEIVARKGVGGLYTNSLFHWKRPFLERIHPALELGRSFVRLEYQKTYAPLLLLWKGIGQFLVRNPRYRVRFGPVSISNCYNETSRQLIVSFLREYRQSRDLAPLVRARNPFRRRPSRLAQELLGSASRDIEELSVLIADVEMDRKGVPVLLRQYLKLGGELVAFNVDRKFANALDGLILVDLLKTDVRVLERYMGKGGAASYLAAQQAAGAKFNAVRDRASTRSAGKWGFGKRQDFSGSP